MNIQKIVNIKPIYFLTSKIKLLRKFWLWLFVWQYKHKRIALVDERLIGMYGMKKIHKMIGKHRGKEPLIIDSFEIRFI